MLSISGTYISCNIKIYVRVFTHEQSHTSQPKISLSTNVQAQHYKRNLTDSLHLLSQLVPTNEEHRKFLSYSEL
jgi:hypothetical protein